jgi:hypothetical protein
MEQHLSLKLGELQRAKIVASITGGMLDSPSKMTEYH